MHNQRVTETKSPSKKCFVASVIAAAGSEQRDHADWLLRYIIRPVFDQHFPHYEVHRSDEITTPGLVDAQVISRLLDDDLVIADMTFFNPNVFYEMGLRHMKGTPIIHMIDAGSDIPFDVTTYRAIVYSMKHPDDVDAAKLALQKQVEVIERPGYQTENPVTKARGVIQLRETASPSEQVIMDRLDALENRQRQVEATTGGIARSSQRHTQIEKVATAIELKFKPRMSAEERKKNVLAIQEISDNYVVDGILEWKISEEGGQVRLEGPWPVAIVRAVQNELIELPGIVSVLSKPVFREPGVFD